MSRTRNREETEWLGGETLVRPHPNEPRFSLLRGIIAGGIVVLAGVGLGQRMRGRAGRQGHQPPRERGRTDNAKVQTSQQCVDAASVMAIGVAWGVGVVAGAVTMFLAMTEAGDSLRARLKRTIGTVSDESDRPAEAERRRRAWFPPAGTFL
ncbi:MAG: hypothetical protein NNA20_00420 [Nitrospira sp.]|nr:hypothetical protein [Nitrospira sp.]MCP9441032.1 hypothetical protein [Nitrospira sp.]